MKFRLLHPAFALLALLVANVRGEEFTWTGHGTFTFDVPPTVKLQGRPIAEGAFGFQATPKAAVPALLQLTALVTPSDHAISESFVQNQLKEMAQPMVAGSVEGKSLW